MIRNVISIGYGRHMFTEGNSERARLSECARAVPSFHAIIFSRSTHTLSDQSVSEHFFLYPTHSISSITMIVDAIRVGLRIVRNAPRGTEWCVTAQDPLGAGVAGYVLSRMLHCPLVMQEHGDIFSWSYWKSEKASNRLWYWIARILIRKAERVRVVSRRVQEHIVALGVKKEKVISLPVYTDASAWSAALPKTDLRALYPDASTIVLSVARFVPQKNLSMLVRSFAMLYASDSRALLVLVGKGGEESRVSDLITELGLSQAVIRMPWTNDVVSLMKTADIYALTSNYEGWARVLVEAMMCGLPAVTTEVGCVGEYWLHQKHGVAVPVGDIDSFGRALVELSTRKDIRETYSRDAQVAAQRIFGERDAYIEVWARTLADF